MLQSFLPPSLKLQQAGPPLLIKLLRQIGQQLLILSFLWFSAGGFAYTMTHRWPRFIPWQLTAISYGMMGPWQSYTVENARLIAYGETTLGTWEPIDLEAYYPFLRGEAGIRMMLRPFLAKRGEKYQELAQQLRALEAKRGRPYGRVRLYWEKWPKSPLGFEALRQEPYVTRTFVTQAP
jgi:hypothetical protein